MKRVLLAAVCLLGLTGLASACGPDGDTYKDLAIMDTPSGKKLVSLVIQEQVVTGDGDVKIQPWTYDTAVLGITPKIFINGKAATVEELSIYSFQRIGVKVGVCEQTGNLYFSGGTVWTTSAPTGPPQGGCPTCPNGRCPLR